MKIVQINIVANWGSTGRIAEEIGLKLIEEGFNSYIAYGRYANHSQSKLYHIGSKFNTYYHVLQTRLFDRHGLSSNRATKQFIKWLDAIKPDIIHIHNIHGYYINYKILFEYISKKDIPIVWTMHDCWPFTGHCSHFENINCNKWQIQCHNCPQIQSYPKSLIYDRSYKNFLEKKEYFTKINHIEIVAVSLWMKSILSTSFLNKYPITVKDKFVILGVANIWNKQKGFDDFINLSKLIDNNSVIILVGLNKTQMNQLPSNIIGFERTNDIKSLAILYSLSNVYLNLTYLDTFPTTNIEALACGTPVVTYKTGGSVESITDQTGFIVDQGNINELLSVLNKIKINGKSYYLKTCCKHANNHFCKNNQYDKYIQLYKNILQI